MPKFVLILLLCCIPAAAQTETGYWGKAEIKYERDSKFRQRDYTFRSTGITGTLAETITKSYWFFISDLDGDNCPFRPSCSEFFQESISKTNIFIGTLLFFDRFTRDLNFITRHQHYERTPEGYYVDPPEKHIF
jgi:putative component of membrane protein insertase Oxa1/YidC/SpoIIIJ protein YidD